MNERISIIKTIKKYLLKTGIEIRRLPTPERFYNNKKEKREAVQEFELKKITNLAAIADNHTYYNNLMKLYIPNWDIKIQKASFIGEGIGVGSLNIFRKISIGQEDYFEKIYFNSHRDLERIKWFQEHIYALIRNKIKVPRVQKLYSGELLTIIYFKYFNLTDLKEGRKEKAIIEFSKDLYRISCTNEITLSKLEIPSNVKDFRKHFEYQSNINLARCKLKEYGIACHSFEQEAAASKHIITHADIQETNVFKNAVLIDWDTFGIYPVGLEQAFIYFRLLMKNNHRGADVMEWLEKHYGKVLSKEDWKNFNRNFFFFLFVFSAKRIYRGIFNHIEQPLVEKLKML